MARKLQGHCLMCAKPKEKRNGRPRTLVLKKWAGDWYSVACSRCGSDWSGRTVDGILFAAGASR